MFSNMFYLPLLFIAAVSAAPSRTTVERADSCGQWDSIKTGTYTVYNNLWGKDQATSGSQCFGVDGASGSTVKWHASCVVSIEPTTLA